MTTRKILTVNQAFEILVKWVETRDWEQALYSVIPKRKHDQDGQDDPNDDETEADNVQVQEGLETEGAVSQSTVQDNKAKRENVETMSKDVTIEAKFPEELIQL